MSNTLSELASPVWRKSSYSTDTGGNCVEVAEIWRKSSYSGEGGRECVEVADLDLGTGVRDSKHPEAGHLLFPSSEWTGFLKNLH